MIFFSWLGRLLRSKSKALVEKSRLYVSLDAITKYLRWDNTDIVSNLLDFGRTDPFSFAAIVHPSNLNNIRIVEKRNSNSGYVFGTTTDNLIFIGFNTASGLQGIRSASGYNFATDPLTIFIGTYDGSGSTNGFSIHQYRFNGVFSATISAGAGTSVPLGSASMSGTLKNTVATVIGRNFIGGTDLRTKSNISHLSAWKKALSRSESDDLAMKMLTDNVKNHSAYSSDCVGYIREFAGRLVGKNEVNNNYNLSFLDF